MVYANERGEFIDDAPKDLPKPFEKELVIRMMVDSDHAGDHVTRRRRSEFFGVFEFCIDLLDLEETNNDWHVIFW